MRRLRLVPVLAATVLVIGVAVATGPTAAGGASSVSRATPHAVSGLPGAPVKAIIPGAVTYSGAHCQNYYFPITESAGSTTIYKEFGQLCTRDPSKLGQQPVQVLIHGGTYNHAYYDWPYQPQRYNYVRYMTERGFTTLNLDRLGYGYSSHPVSVTMNFTVAAFNTHQIVQYLRRGALGPKFGTVVTNGYSMGGLTAQVEDGSYHDVNALMVHAVGHGLLTARSTERLSTSFYPAALDPKFASASWSKDPGYLTSIPGKRSLFYGPASTFDPKQLAYEDKLKDTLSATELTDITLRTYTDQTRNITAPILWEPGEYDKIWCGTTDDCNTDPETMNEHNYYRPGVFTKYVVQNTGHGDLLGYGGVDYMREIVSWLGQHGVHGVQ